MKMVTPLLRHAIEIDDERISSVVIESGSLFRRFVEDLYACADGSDDSFILSEGLEERKPSQVLELIMSFVPFTLNTKTLLTALLKKLEKIALSPGVREQTEQMISETTRFVKGLTFEIPHEISCEGLSAASLIKACALSFEEETVELADKLIDYHRLIREFVGERIFVWVNARQYFSDDEMNRLLMLCLQEHFKVLLVDGVERTLFPYENRLLVDKDLCELTSADDNMV